MAEPTTKQLPYGGTIAEALVRVAAGVRYLEKRGDVDGAGLRYSYVKAEDVVGRVNELLCHEGIAVTRAEVEILYFVPYSGKGLPANAAAQSAGTPQQPMNAAVRVSCCLRHAASGEEAGPFQGVGSGVDNGDKATMKAETAARKNLWAVAFNISWGDDPEATDEDGRPTGQNAKKSKQRPPREQDPLLLKIQAAGTIAELDGLRPAVRARREAATTNTEKERVYALIQAHTRRMEELGQLPLPGIAGANGAAGEAGAAG